MGLGGEFVLEQVKKYPVLQNQHFLVFIKILLKCQDITHSEQQFLKLKEKSSLTDVLWRRPEVITVKNVDFPS